MYGGFPYITGQYGGAAFVLLYLLFLVAMGLPIMTMEFSVGRASPALGGIELPRARTKGNKMASGGLSGHDRQLPADDVLHHDCGVDAILRVQDGHWRI